MLFPANADNSEGAMRLLELLTDNDLARDVHYGVPNIHYVITGTDEYKRLNRCFSFYRSGVNPFAALCIVEPSLLFESDIPDFIRHEIRQARATGYTYVQDPLNGFVFDQTPVRDAYNRYHGSHARTYSELLRSNPVLFDFRYNEFKKIAGADFQAIQLEAQKQIYAFLEAKTGKKP